MTTRDRLMLMGIVALLVLLGAWFVVVSPERQKADKVAAEVTSARAQLAGAESQEAEAHNAQASYATAYTSLVSLGQAVPASTETPALIYELDHASNSRDVQFSSITSGGSSDTSTTSTSSGTTGASSTPSSGFSQQPFTFIFSGNFEHLYKLLDQLEGFTAQTPNGTLRVDGRLLTIDGVNLTPDSDETGGSGSGKSKAGELTGTITATAYVLPASQSALGGASQSGPAGANSTTTTTGSSATTPAVVKANP
jgi:hypothetical protein